MVNSVPRHPFFLSPQCMRYVIFILYNIKKEWQMPIHLQHNKILSFFITLLISSIYLKWIDLVFIL